MNRIITLLLSFFLVECHNETRQKPILPTENSPPLTMEYYRKQIKSMDTLTARGNYLHYSIDDSSNTIITWGNLKTGDVGTFMSERYPGWAPHWYLNEWRNYIGLRYDCGTSCWDLTLLPLNKKDSIFTVMEDFACDTTRGFIFCQSPKENEMYRVVNVATKKEQEIKLADIDTTTFLMGVIDSAAFVEKGLYVKWKTRMNVEPYSETKEKVFRISK